MNCWFDPSAETHVDKRMHVEELGIFSYLFLISSSTSSFSALLGVISKGGIARKAPGTRYAFLAVFAELWSESALYLKEFKKKWN